MHIMQEKHEDWKHLWKCETYKPIPNMEKLIKLMNDTTQAEESGRTHKYTEEWVYLGIKQDVTRERNINRGQASSTDLAYDNLEIHNTDTHESINRKNPTEEKERI